MPPFGLTGWTIPLGMPDFGPASGKAVVRAKGRPWRTQSGIAIHSMISRVVLRINQLNSPIWDA
jgi:hypothetical protein